MKKNLRAIFLNVFLGCAFLLIGQSSKAQSNAGTDFWFNFPQDNPLVTGASAFSEKKFFMISFYNTKVKVEWPAALDEMPPVNLTAGIPYTFEIPDPYTDYADSYAEFIDVNGIHITSEYPVAIYAISFDAASSEICPVLPYEKLGTEYLSVAYRENTGSGFSARVNIVATEDNTVVKFELPETLYTSNESNSKQLRKPKEKWTINLKKGETYSVFCNQNGKGTGTKPEGFTPKTGTIGNNLGLNGMKISSTKKIAVLGGADCTWAGLKQYPGCGACDITFTQLLPTNLWQKEFVTTQTLVRFNNTRGSTSTASIADYLLITAKDSNTVVNITGKASATKTLQAGEFWFYESPGKGVDPTDPGASNHLIRANNPISICQIQKGWQCDNNQAGDPSQMLVFDTKSWQNNYNITTPLGTSVYGNNFVNLIVKDTGIPGNTSRSVKIYNSQSGAQIPVPDANWVQIGSEPYFYNRVTLPAPGGIKLVSDSLFSFYASGSSTANSYSYMGGQSCIFDIKAGADSIYVPSGQPIPPTTFKIISNQFGKLVVGGTGELAPTYTWTPNINTPACYGYRS